MKRSRELDEEASPGLQDSQYGHAEGASVLDVATRPAAKITELDSAVCDPDNDVAMKCHLPPHKEPLTFKSYAEYESHYASFHTNRCLECRKNFPSQHLLGVHIEEFHDPLVVIRRDKGEHTYSCFVEGCERRCMTPQKRRMHLIDKHMYPKNFFFAITRDGIDGRRSLLVDHGHARRRSSTSTQPKDSTLRRASLQDAQDPRARSEPVSSPAHQTSPPATKSGSNNSIVDTDMADLTGAMSALQFVPSSIRFGRGRPGFSKR
ncbi:hypothetical protein S7711_05701 [Stachybotrys chartarum IBT 7711]|uniref:C2H2-type domain-containing protein n=1 Tax=Stachybotrys chartarum (strain CBS 109288 / IBT 7711) TaxID=1280523 RepID=A0A084AVQ8_STACB|nr:hypothetical protein S7711_05701 [Stachybotrys chartarum IBT 7711]KFA45705.1 hypothetical protein S40293_09440 [Stachybotrys chartarum IBT 40293]KFA72711.1 hypothetical protein S40288_07631 [Stachybotrys chartarum IBT 40288]